MARGEKQPVQGSTAPFAAILALTIVSAAPVLAAPDRNINCEEASSATLKIAETEFSTTRIASPEESVKLLRPDFELASRGATADEDHDSEQTEQAVEDDSEDAQQREATLPADAGPMVHKRQMYRRDI